MKNVLLWVARGVAAIIMLQTLYFKFSGAAESVEIFTRVQMEPWGRYLVGSLEAIASILLLIPAVSWAGAVLALGLMTGAIGMHLTILGIEVQGDGGQLFFYAIAVTVASLVVLWYQRNEALRVVKGIVS
jgi:uncharacterized membrane protein YphA (DoxX/SURF4 family)